MEHLIADFAGRHELEECSEAFALTDDDNGNVLAVLKKGDNFMDRLKTAIRENNAADDEDVPTFTNVRDSEKYAICEFDVTYPDASVYSYTLTPVLMY